MKLILTLLGASLLSLALAAGCTETPKTRAEATPPSITVAANHKTMVPGEATIVYARTKNVVGAQPIRWEVVGDEGGKNAKITPEQSTAHQTAIFSADRPGTYTVRAIADWGGGRTVANETQIQVLGRDEMPRQAHE